MDDLCNFSDYIKPFDREVHSADIGIWILNEPVGRFSNWLQFIDSKILNDALLVDLLPAKSLVEPKLSVKLKSHWIGLFPLHGIGNGINVESSPWLLSSNDFDRTPLRKAEMLVHSLDGRPAQVTPSQSDTIVAWTHLAPQLYRAHFENSIRAALEPIAPDLPASTDWLCQCFDVEFETEMKHLNSLIPRDIKLG